MSRRTRVFEVKSATVMETLVYEWIVTPEERIEFHYADLEHWGYDLASGRRDRHGAYFLAEVEEGRRAGDRYEEEGRCYEIDEVLSALPAEMRLMGRIEMHDGKACLALELSRDQALHALGRLPAAELLFYYLDKQRLHRLMGALQDVGRLTTLAHSRGQSGRALPYEALPPEFHHFIREARGIARKMGAGRIALACFGQNKDRRQRFHLTWQVPTLALFDLSYAKRIERLLETLDG